MTPQINKLLVIFIIVSLLVSLSFLGGVDLLMHQFCSTSSDGGFCGALHGISGMMGHLSFIETILFFLPALLAALILTYRLLSNHESVIQNNRTVSLAIHSIVAPSEERFWLAYHTNSPNIY
jgi:hypothetical protein